MPALIEESAANCPLSFDKRNTQNSKKFIKIKIVPNEMR